jgi:hypothetical protein
MLEYQDNPLSFKKKSTYVLRKLVYGHRVNLTPVGRQINPKNKPNKI